MDTDEFEAKFEELAKKWHKLLKLLNNLEIIGYDERDNLELDDYKDRKMERAWNS